MQLPIEFMKKMSTIGKHPNLVHYWDNQVQFFYIDPEDTQIYCMIGKWQNEDWENIEFYGKRRILASESKITYLNVQKVLENMVIGTYVADSVQKYFLYEY